MKISASTLAVALGLGVVLTAADRVNFDSAAAGSPPPGWTASRAGIDFQAARMRPCRGDYSSIG